MPTNSQPINILRLFVIESNILLIAFAFCPSFSRFSLRKLNYKATQLELMAQIINMHTPG